MTDRLTSVALLLALALDEHLAGLSGPAAPFALAHDSGLAHGASSSRMSKSGSFDSLFLHAFTSLTFENFMIELCVCKIYETVCAVVVDSS